MSRNHHTISFLRKPEKAAYFFLSPAAIILAVFVFIPLGAAVIISFQNLTIYLDPAHFVGLKNYLNILVDPRFWNALRNTLLFLVLEMPLHVILGLVVAVALSQTNLFTKFMRSVFFLPAVCSLTAISIVWSFLLDPNMGTIPYYFEKLGFPGLQFLHDSHMAMPVVAGITIWKNFGMTMIIFIGGLQSIPQSYYEASEIDGANRTDQFFHITVPLLVPTINFCVITNMIGSLQVFDQIYVLTSGGPLFSTETLVMYIYDTGFKSAPYDLSYASAIAVVLFLIIMIITLISNRFFTSRETVDM